jgi:hypothetical protein
LLFLGGLVANISSGIFILFCMIFKVIHIPKNWYTHRRTKMGKVGGIATAAADVTADDTTALQFEVCSRGEVI